MSSAALALQTAVVQALSNAPQIATLSGGTARIFDHVPPGTPQPYITIAQTLERDWSTGTETGHEHILTLQVWSRASGRRQVHDLAAAVRSTLHDAGLSLAGHSLINLRHEFTETRREPDGETYRGILRYRAVTEPL